MSFNECEICGYTGDRVALAGGLITDLCKDHRNEWHEYIRKIPVTQNRQATEAEISAVVRAGQSQLARGLAIRLYNCEDELFKLAKAWVAAQQDATSEPKAEGDET